MDIIWLMARQYGKKYGRSVEYVKVKTVFTSESEKILFLFSHIQRFFRILRSTEISDC